VKKICILDYGLGNIKSLYNSLKKIGFSPNFYSDNQSEIYDFIFIPGVGSFSKGSELIKKNYLSFLNNSLKNEISIFGICLGMQLLLSEGEENGINPGLNFINGKVKYLGKEKKMKLPIIGWNKVEFNYSDRFSFLKNYQNEKFYFIHSYAAYLYNEENQLSTSTYKDIKYTSSIINKKCIGTQFHPEKSGEIGLEFLKDWITKT